MQAGLWQKERNPSLNFGKCSKKQSGKEWIEQMFGKLKLHLHIWENNLFSFIKVAQPLWKTTYLHFAQEHYNNNQKETFSLLLFLRNAARLKVKIYVKMHKCNPLMGPESETL